MSTLQVANAILAQMGGIRKLKMMIGAKHFVGGDNQVSFSFPGSTRANKVTVELTPMDVYSMSFYKIRGGTVSPVYIEEQVYNTELIKTFEKFTGLYLHF